MKNRIGLFFASALLLVGAAHADEPTANVAFSVDMSVQIALGTFDTNTMGVEVRGDFSGWGTALTLTREGMTAVYSGTTSITSLNGSGGVALYKFFGTGGLGALEWETIAENRSVLLNPGEDPQVLPTAYFNEQGPETVKAAVLFTVDMTAEVGFNPTNHRVAVRGTFNDWNEVELSRQGVSLIYTGLVTVITNEAALVDFKFWYDGPDVWEPLPGGANHSFVMAGWGATNVLPVIPFGYVPQADITFSVNMAFVEDFDANTQTVEVHGSFNQWAGITLDRVGDTPIFSKTVAVYADEGARVDYKFWFDDGDQGLWEEIENRSFIMGEDAVPRVLPTGIFGIEADGEATAVVRFSVDMSGESGFDTGRVVAVRGTFNDWNVFALQREGETLIYSRAAPVTADEASTVTYKFWYDDGSLGQWEELDTDRTFTMGANGTTNILPLVPFGELAEEQGPAIGPITYNSGSGTFSTAIPPGYQVAAVERAPLSVSGGEWSWSELTEGTDYTIDGSVVLVEPAAEGDAIIRIYWTPE